MNWDEVAKSIMIKNVPGQNSEAATWRESVLLWMPDQR